jgi:Icc-related predicted phosphoesterase
MNYEAIRSLLYCIEENKKDDKSLIVVTHYSPTFDMFDNMRKKDPTDLMNYWYCNQLDNLINSDNMAMWLFGHTHTPYQERINGTLVMSNPYVHGYSRQMEIRIN